MAPGAAGTLPTDLSNQDLYELVQDFHTATLQASEVAQKTRPLVSLLKEGYAKDAKRYRIARNASGAIFGLLSAVAVLGIWNPVGWAAFVDRDIDAVNTHLMYAQEAVALVFSAQILQTPLDENFPDHRRREILATLGVDVDGITDPMGSQELMRDRLQMFLGSIARLRTSMEHILKDANFPLQIFEEAA
ncbi:hypothetical protein MGN70_004530 [Eutypa lata]|nr:hypothetical protein MGN70_004530 [Eutypa lata]